MRIAGYALLGLAYGFGLWGLVFPESVNRVYTRLHRGRVTSPSSLAVRTMGALWIVLLFTAQMILAKR